MKKKTKQFVLRSIQILKQFNKNCTDLFLKKLKITISQQNINFIINKSNNERENLLNELKKIELLTISKKNLTIEEIIKIVNLGENHSIHEHD